jgi:urease accessory protein
VTLVVREIVGHGDDPRFIGRRRELLGVGSEEAQRRRLRRATADGTKVAIDLPRGSFLRQSAVLHDDGERIIIVERSPEPALVVRLEASLPCQLLLEQAARVGHWAGNQHLLAEVAGYEIRVRIATTAELMLQSARALALQGAELTAAQVPFALEHAPSHPHGHG